jgi:hypothetical protein
VATHSKQSVIKGYTEGLISPKLPKSTKKTYAISQFLAKILPVAISPNVPVSLKMSDIAEFYVIYITNYFLLLYYVT